jgi:hypothetical protein
MLGLFIATYIGAALPVAASASPWRTSQLGPTLVLLPVGCAVVLGLATLWTGLAIQRRTRGVNPTTLATGRIRTPAAAIIAMSGRSPS